MLRDADPARLEADLAQKITEASGSLTGGLGVIDVSAVAGQQVDVAALAEMVRRLGLHPIAVQGADAQCEAQAQALGLAVLPAEAAIARNVKPIRETAEPVGKNAATDSAAPEAATATAAPQDMRSALGSHSPPGRSAPAQSALPQSAVAQSTPAPSAPAHAALAQSTPTQSTRMQEPAAGQSTAVQTGHAPAASAREPRRAMVISTPLRSGQRVYARDRDLVLLSHSSPGSELIADGHIHCYGPLRGRAVAGASGDTGAQVFALDFQAELVSIAGVYKAFDPLPEDVNGKPVRVSLRPDGDHPHLDVAPLAQR